MNRRIIRSLTVGVVSIGLFAATASVASATGTPKRTLAQYELQLKDYKAAVQTINLTFQLAIQTATAAKAAARAALAEAVAAAWQNYGNALSGSNTAAMSAALSTFNAAVTAAVLAQQNAVTALGPKPVPPVK